LTLDIRHDESRQRFETTVDGHLCVADYRLHGDVMWMTHTGVPAAVGGRGIAAQLVRAALDHARANGLKVEPMCSYVDAYMRRHPEVDDLRA
jgi:predicted GNAT family acetyltransferase